MLQRQHQQLEQIRTPHQVPTKRKDHDQTKAAQKARLIHMNQTAVRQPRSRKDAQRRLVLHVGGHKTGTTSLQALLTPDAPYLERSDMWTPDFGQGQDGAHHHLIYRLIGATSRIDQRDALSELRGLAAMEGRTCLISSEFIHHLMIFQPSVFRALIATFRTMFDEVKIVQVIRETASLINSRYQQTLCNFIQNDEFPKYARQYLEMERRLLNRTMKGFALETRRRGVSFVVLPYQPHLPDFDAIGLVTKAVGMTTPATPPRKNEGRTLEQMAVSKQLMTSDIVPLSEMVHSQRFALHQAVAKAVPRAGATLRFQGFDDALLAEVTTANANLRDRFAKMFWGKTWGDTFGTLSLSPYQGLATTDLPSPSRARIAKAVDDVAALVPAIMNAPVKKPWDITVKSQFTELAKLNQAARAHEQRN